MTQDTPQRMWINQPSTQQPLHQLHGVRVLAISDGHDYSRIYFLEGEVLSARVPSSYLSSGWPSTTRIAGRHANLEMENKP